MHTPFTRSADRVIEQRSEAEKSRMQAYRAAMPLRRHPPGMESNAPYVAVFRSDQQHLASKARPTSLSFRAYTNCGPSLGFARLDHAMFR